MRRSVKGGIAFKADDKGVEENPDMMRALSQIPVMKLASIDEAFVMLDSGLGAIFSAGMARRAAMERAKQMVKEESAKFPVRKQKAGTSKMRTAEVLRRAVDKSRQTAKKHAAQATTMGFLTDLGKGDNASNQNGPCIRTRGHVAALIQARKFSITSKGDGPFLMSDSQASLVESEQSHKNSVAPRADVALPKDAAFLEWAETAIGMPSEKLEGLENTVTWHAKMKHQMLCWEAQRADKLSPPGLTLNKFKPDRLDDLVAQTSEIPEETRILDILGPERQHKDSHTTLSTVASTTSLQVAMTPGGGNISSDSIAPDCIISPPVLAPPGKSRLAASLSPSFQAAGQALFGLAHHASLHRARRSRIPLVISEDAAGIASPSYGSGTKPIVQLAPLAIERLRGPGEIPKWPGRERSLPPLLMEPPSSTVAQPHTARELRLPPVEQLPGLPLSARAKAGFSPPVPQPSATRRGVSDKWTYRLNSHGQTRDLLVGPALRAPPAFIEPHREIVSTDIGATPEHAYLRRCESMGLVPHPGVWSHFGGDKGIIDASKRALRDNDVVAIMETAVGQLLEGHSLCLLDLSENALSDAGLRQVARLVLPNPGFLPTFSNLSALSLAGNTMLKFRAVGVMEDFAAALESLPNLSNLDLSDVPLHAQTIKLCAALERCPSLENLSLANCGVGRTDQNECVAVSSLLGSRPETNWQGLLTADFSQNFFGHAGFAAAAASLRYSRLTSLSFAGNANSSTWMVCGKEVRFHPAQLLLEGLQFNRTLQALSLATCNIGPDTAFVLEDAAQSHICLRDLDFSDNPLGDTGLRSILRLLMSLETEGHSVNVEAHREADVTAHVIKFRLAQPGGTYRLNLRYPHDRSTFRFLLKHLRKLRSGVFRHFKFDSKLGKPNIEKDPETNQWVVPTSGMFSFTYLPPMSSSMHACVEKAAEKKREEAAAADWTSSVVGTSRSGKERRTSIIEDHFKQRKTFLAGGVVGFLAGSEARGSVAPPPGPARAVRESTFRSTFIPSSAKLEPELLADWTEVDGLFDATRLRVSALRFSTLRSMFISFVTREEQLRFIHACSKDLGFNFAQVNQFCKDRPDISSQIVSSLFPSLSSRPSQLLLLGQLNMTVAPAIAKEVSPCLWMQAGNLTGTHSLDLLKPANYWVAENCLLVNAWESEVSKMQQNPDVSQRGNFEMLRNEVYNETPFSYNREWSLPSHGFLRFDYSSIRRPSPMIAAMPEASEVTRYMQRSQAAAEAKLRALRAISSHLFLSTHQFRNLVLCLPAGSARQDFFCMFHTRVVDAIRFLGPDLLYNPSIFSQEDRQMLSRRVGALHLLNPIHPEGVMFQSNLAVYEERMIVEYLVQLSTEEPGGKVMGAMGVNISDNDIVFKPVPASWADKGVPSNIEKLVCRYETTTVNLQWRMTLAEKYCIGLFN